MKLSNTQAQLDPIEQVRQAIILGISEIIESAFAGKVLDAQFKAIRLGIESLPLTIEEFSKSMNHLNNAQRYLVSQERGAARYELRMLLPMLKNQETTAERSFRRRRDLSSNDHRHMIVALT